MTNTYGYVRVSSTDQNEDRQMIALSACEIPQKNIYIDLGLYYVLPKRRGEQVEKRFRMRISRKKKKASNHTWLLAFRMAEWVGFEPTDGCPSPDFESGPL